MTGDQTIQSYNMNSYQPAIDTALASLQTGRIVPRIWDKDYTVWKPEPDEISNRLGWLDIANRMQSQVAQISSLVQSVQQAGYTHALVLGMGGSSLAPDVFHKTFPSHPPFFQLAVLDSTDPGAVLEAAKRSDPAKTLYIVSTKSGGTVETLSFFKYFYNLTVDAVGKENAGAHFVAITDPGSKLVDLAVHYNFRETFLNDPNIGGRYSALSFFGLVPAALIGIDIRELLSRATASMQTCQSEDENPGAYLGVIMGELSKTGRDKITILSSSSIQSFGDWVEQLIAESTGKEGKGILPVVHEPVGKPSVYGNDRLFVVLNLVNDPASDDVLHTLKETGSPVLVLTLNDKTAIGSQFFLWEFATAIAGRQLGINPFDQPNVESAKVQARKMVAAYQAKGKLPEQHPFLTEDNIAVYGNAYGKTIKDALTAFIDTAQQGSYITLQAFIQPTADAERVLQELRTTLRDRTKLAVTTGYGPRFLHSTGQLHKGDAGRGLFIQFTSDPIDDIAIPDQAGSNPSSITFGVLKMAQALGDNQALTEAGRKVIRFHLSNAPVAGINYLLSGFD